MSADKGVSCAEREFLKKFHEFQLLEQELENAQLQISSLKNQIFVRKEVLLLYERLEAVDKILSNEILPKAAESLRSLDKFGLYEHLKDAFLTLFERMTEETASEFGSSDTEIRAVHFLYLLLRFVESNKRFPKAWEMKKLFDGNLQLIDSEDKILHESLQKSPMTRSVCKLQRKQAQRTSVGCGDTGTKW